MGDAQKHRTGLLVFLLDILFHRLRQRFVAGLVALHDLSASLRHDDQMVVFIYYFHISLLNELLLTCKDNNKK